jgi:hypothetical protein
MLDIVYIVTIPFGLIIKCTVHKTVNVWINTCKVNIYLVSEFSALHKKNIIKKLPNNNIFYVVFTVS